jgi:hypothetical protein
MSCGCDLERRRHRPGGTTRTPLHDLADTGHGRLEVEVLDINAPAQLATLRDRLSGRRFDMLFVNAGTTNNERTPIGHVPADETGKTRP